MLAYFHHYCFFLKHIAYHALICKISDQQIMFHKNTFPWVQGDQSNVGHMCSGQQLMKHKQKSFSSLSKNTNEKESKEQWPSG